jgi:hypothetical protein
MSMDKKKMKLLASLKAQLGSAVVDQSASESQLRYAPWNDGEPGRPLARVICNKADDIRLALQIARDYEASVSISSGRHDPYGRPKQDDCILLDLKPMSGVHYSPKHGIVTVEGGATTGDLVRALPDDIVTVTGTNPEIGVAGITSGGGYGMLNSKFGLACDVLEGAELLLYDGNRAIASATENSDLFWAMRGGGTGFGVVTSMIFRTFRLPAVWSAQLMVPLRTAEKGLLLMQQLLDREPDQLSILPLFTIGQDGTCVLILWIVWNGKANGEQIVLRAFRDVEGVEVLQQGFTPYKESLDSGALWPWGQRWSVETQTVSRIDKTLAATLVQAAHDMPGSNSILFLHEFHGAPTRVPPEATAFPLRTNHFVWLACGHWSEGDDEAADRQRAWVRDATGAIKTLALPGGYINFLRPSETHRVRQFYGASADRLLRLKRQCDPHAMFVAATGQFRGAGPDELSPSV